MLRFLRGMKVRLQPHQLSPLQKRNAPKQWGRGSLILCKATTVMPKGRSMSSNTTNIFVILGATAARFGSAYALKVLAVLTFGASSLYYWVLYRAVGLTKEQEEQLRAFIISTDKKFAPKGIADQSSAVEGFADLYMHQLLKLFFNLASQTRNGLVITKESWDRSNASLPPNEREIASLLFQGGDLDHDGSLSFQEFARLAVLKAAAGTGDVESQVELLFELMDTEGTGAISLAECDRFVRTCVRNGKLRPAGGDTSDAAAHALALQLFARADRDRDGAVTRDEFRRTIGPALYRDLWPSTAATRSGRGGLAAHQKPAAAGGGGAAPAAESLAAADRGFSLLLREYRAVRPALAAAVGRRAAAPTLPHLAPRPGGLRIEPPPMLPPAVTAGTAGGLNNKSP